MENLYIKTSVDKLLADIEDFNETTKNFKQGSIIIMRKLVHSICERLLHLDIDDNTVKFADETRAKIENIFNDRFATLVAKEVQDKARSIIGQYQDIIKTILDN